MWLETRFLFGFSRISIFLLLLLIGLLGLIVNSKFQSDVLTSSWLSVSLLGLITNGVIHLAFKDSRIARLVGVILCNLFISYLFIQMQSSQSLFIVLILLNIMITGLQDGTEDATHVTLFSSMAFSLSLILSQNFSHFQDLLSLGLFNLSCFMTAALSGFFSEKLKVSESALTQSEDLLEDLSTRHHVLIEELPMGILVFSQSGNLVEKNSYYDEQLSMLIQSDELLKDSGQLKIHKRISHLGNTRDLVIRYQKLVSGKKNYIMVLIEDVTENRKLEENLKQNEKMAAIGTLAAGIAHEIRNPLAGMSGSIELLSMNPNTEEDKKLFRIILREIDRLNRLISEFLDYSKPNTVETDKISIRIVVLGVLKLLEDSPDRPKDIELVTNLNEDAFILGSQDKLKQAFLNIIINSFQAMKTTERPRVEILLQKSSDGKSVVLKVSDNGMGMKPETKVKMFEPFHTTKPKGTGLGLAITHKILQAHQAIIHVESELGRGTEFQLIFPCAE
jgi:two-component system sensor histidine kinase PilS (NtrC family)